MNDLDLQSRITELGYAVIPTGIAPSRLEEAVDAVRSRLKISANDTASWAKVDGTTRGFVPIWNSTELWAIRSEKSIADTFRILHQADEVWTSVDRCHFKPPVETNLSLGAQHFLHWDSDSSDPQFHKYQGVLALTDTPYDQGSFVCSPALFSLVRDGRVDMAQAAINRGVAEVIQVGCNAGDLIVWDHRLPHGNSANVGAQPRLAMYLTFDEPGSSSELRKRTDDWRTGRWPHGPSRYPGFDRTDDRAPNLAEFWTEGLGLSEETRG